MSKKRLFIIIVITVLAFVLIAASSKAKKDIVYINPTSGEVTIDKNQVAVARFGWLACSAGLVQDFIDHFEIDLELYQDSELLQTVMAEDGYWDQYSGTELPQYTCLHINEPYYGRWYYENLKLNHPGTYMLLFHYGWTVPMADGFDINQDGFIDVYAPVSLSRNVIITVLP